MVDAKRGDRRAPGGMGCMLLGVGPGGQGQVEHGVRIKGGWTQPWDSGTEGPWGHGEGGAPWEWWTFGEDSRDLHSVSLNNPWGRERTQTVQGSRDEGLGGQAMVGTLRSGRVSWEGGHHTPLVFVSCRTSDISESSQKPGFAEIFIHKGLQGSSMSTGLPHGYCTPGAGWPVLPTLPQVPTYRPHTQPHSRRKQGPSRPAPPVLASRKPGQHQHPSTRTKTPIPSGGGRGLKQHEAVVFSLEDRPPCPSTRDVNQRLEGPPSLIRELGQQAALCCMRALARAGWGQALQGGALGP